MKEELDTMVLMRYVGLLPVEGGFYSKFYKN